MRIALCLLPAAATAFTVTTKARISHALRMETIVNSDFKSDFASDFESAMPDISASPLEKIGVEEGKLALGVDPNEVFKYIGTREDLIAKTMSDVQTFDRATAEKEVDKFLMDAEMVNLYIQFQKKLEEDPDFAVPAEKEEGFFSFRTLVFGYLGYVILTSVPAYFRKYVAEQEAAGTWQGTNIPLVDEWIEKTRPAVEAAQQAAAEAAQSASADVVQAVSDAVQSSGLQ